MAKFGNGSSAACVWTWLLMTRPLNQALKVYKSLDVDLSAFKYKALSVSAKMFISVHP